MLSKNLKEQYYLLLRNHFIKPEEQQLFDISELGQDLVRSEVPPEEIGELHEEAILRLGVEFPEVSLLETISKISEPLMELLMSYGLAFRKQLAEIIQVQEDLEKSEDRFRTFFMTASDLMFIVDKKQQRNSKSRLKNLPTKRDRILTMYG